MLLSLFSLTCLLAVHLAKAGAGGSACIAGISSTFKSSVSGSNYAVDTFNGYPFAYAIGYCTALDLIGDYATFTCDSTGVITKTVYATSDCSGNSVATMKVKEGYCGGDNNYGKVTVAIDSKCKTGVTVYGGLGACVDVNFPFYAELYCNGTETALQFYLPIDIPTQGATTSTINPIFGSSSMSPATTSTFAGTTSTLVGTTSTWEPLMSSMMSSDMAEPSSTESSYYTSSAIVEVTPDPKICNSKAACFRWVFTGSDGGCHAIGMLGGNTLYGSTASGECVVSSTTTGKKSASSLVAIINLVVAFAVALFSLF